MLRSSLVDEGIKVRCLHVSTLTKKIAVTATFGGSNVAGAGGDAVELSLGNRTHITHTLIAHGFVYLTRMLTIMSASSCSRLWQWNT